MIGQLHRFNVGDIRCTLICDAQQVVDARGFLFPEVPANELDNAFARHNLNPSAAAFSINILVIQTEQHTILVDTGLGPGPSQLPDSLQKAGFDLNQITRVIITHGHPDHIGGITKRDNKLAFPNARYCIWKSEWDFWTEHAVKTSDPDDFARRNLIPIYDYVDVIESESEFLPGIHAVSTPGHTIGHMSVMVESGSHRLLHFVDVVHHPLQITYPDWQPRVDKQPDVAVSTRRRLVERAGKGHLQALAYHFPFPGLGHVVREGEGWRWEALETT